MDVVVCTADQCERALLTTLVQRTDATSSAVESMKDLLARWPDYAADVIVS